MDLKRKVSMLRTRLTGEEVGEFDDAITKWIKENTFTGVGHNMIIGIENRYSRVYRVIEVTGLQDFVDVMELMCSFNLVDITEIPYAPKKGFDGRFRYPDLIYLSKNSHRMVTIPQ